MSDHPLASENPLTAQHPVSLADIDPVVDLRQALFQKLQMFDQDVAKARMVGEKDATGKIWVETDAQVLDYHFPQGLGNAKYAIYRGVFVTLKDESKKVSAALAQERLGSGFSDPRVRIVGLT